MIHDLKILPEWFNAVISGVKTFEIRKDDRNYQPRDELLLREWDGTAYTGRTCKADVTMVLRGEYCREGYCTMAIRVHGLAETVQRGRWVVNDRNPDYADCTNCGLSEWLGANGSRDYAETLLSGFKKFCPNCGARMDGGTEDGRSKAD